jgi:hypothetical protein
VQPELREGELTDYRGNCCDRKGDDLPSGSDDDKSVRVKGI